MTNKKTPGIFYKTGELCFATVITLYFIGIGYTSFLEEVLKILECRGPRKVFEECGRGDLSQWACYLYTQSILVQKPRSYAEEYQEMLQQRYGMKPLTFGIKNKQEMTTAIIGLFIVCVILFMTGIWCCLIQVAVTYRRTLCCRRRCRRV